MASNNRSKSAAVGASAPISRAFGALREAWCQGRPIVPLFGAGISVSAAIPFGKQLQDYLVRVAYLCHLDGWRDCHEYLMAEGWPSRHDLNAELWARPDIKPDLRTALAHHERRIAEQVFLGELDRGHPTGRRAFEALLGAGNGPDAAALRSIVSQYVRDTVGSFVPAWLSLIHYLAGGNDSLIEAFFDRLVRGRQPGPAHQFVAYLAKLLGWRLILTTNFDELIENALRADGLNPVVYELVRGGALPDPYLVERNLAVLKLHGGAFGLRTGFELHEPLDAQSLGMFMRYVPSDALLLVVGQGGTERRILTLVHALAARSQQHQFNVVWIYYDQKPQAFSQRLAPRVVLAPYGDAASFFHELYQRLNFSHPVGRNPYRVIHCLPERTAPPAPRSILVEHYQSHASPGSVQLWFNLYQFSSVAGFISLLLEELQLQDRWLVPLVLSPVLREPQDRDGVPDRWAQYLAYALRRHPYFIAVDASNAFADPPLVGGTKASADAEREIVASNRARFFYFMRQLAALDLGGSVVHIAVSEGGDVPAELLPPLPTPNAEPWLATVKLLTATGQESRAIHLHLPVSTDELEHATLRDLRVSSRQTSEARFERAAAQGREDAELLRVAVSFRRPRPFVALVRLTAAALARGKSGHQRDVDSIASGQAIADRGVAEKLALYRRIQEAVERFEADGLFERLDGGLYSMDGAERDALFRYFGEREPERANELQDELATYYRSSLYQQSRDISAYLEYVYHRLNSAHGHPERLQRLFSCLGRESAYLIGRHQAAVVLDALAKIRLRLSHADPSDRAQRDLHLERLELMEVEIWRALNQVDRCVEFHRRRILALTAEPAVEVAPASHQAAPTSGDAEGLAAVLRRVESLAAVLREQGVSVERLPSLLDTIESVLTIAESVSTRHLVQWEAPLIRPLLEQGALALIECIESSAAAGPAAAHAGAPRLAVLKARTCAALMETLLRGKNPWERQRMWFYAGTRAKIEWQPGDIARFDEWYELARNTLLLHGSGNDGTAGLHCTLGCLRARAHYLRGFFGEANELLNRAHAFGERATDPVGLTTLATYYLHRAEYCILHAGALSEPAPNGDDARARAVASGTQRSLLEASRAALEQAEGLLRRGRSDVFWWVRLFILRARAYVEQLRVRGRQRAGEIERALGAGEEEASAALRPEASVSEWEIECERLALAALTALSAGLLNNYQNPQRRALLDELWDELELLWTINGQQRGLDGDTTKSGWDLLNRRVGLDWYATERDRRYQFCDEHRLEVAGVSLTLIDFNARAICLALTDAALLVGRRKLRLRVPAEFRAPRDPPDLSWEGAVLRSPSDGDPRRLVVILAPLRVSERMAMWNMTQHAEVKERLRDSRRPVAAE